MKIRHERPMSDLSFQVRAPLSVELATGEAVTVTKWSLHGFEFPRDCDVLPKEAVLSIPFQGVDIRFPVRLGSEPGSRHLTFQGLTGRQRETLAVFYRSILSGKMASTEDVITSLDAPVDLVPMEETEEERAEGMAGKAPRPLRAALSILTYLVLAMLVFVTLGSGIYARLATVDIRNARIEAPLVEYLAARGGYVEAVLVKPGDTVAAGDILVELATPEGEAALSEVRGRIDLIERRLNDARLRAERFADSIVRARAALTRAVERAGDAELPRAVTALEAFDSGYSPDHSGLFEAHAAVLREIDGLDEELRRLRRERGRLRDAGDALHVMAAEAGTVAAIAVLDGQYVARGASVAVVEGTDARHALGWLDQNMAAALHPGMDVSVTINTAEGRERFRGRVASLEAGIHPDLSPDFGMLVTVAFPDLTAAESRKALPHQMPVELQATRAWAARLQDRIQMLRPWGTG